MSLENTLNQAIEELKKASPFPIASKSGTDFVDGKFKVPFFNRTFLVHHPEVRIEDMVSGAAPPQFLQILLIHYLLTADGTGVADSWITYRHLPDACLFERRFDNLGVHHLIGAFGNDLEGFRQAALSIGGIPISRTGDASFKFKALPHIPLACILYLGDDEVGPSINILFDAAASHYLATEDLSTLGVYLSNSLRSAKVVTASGENQQAK